MANVKLRLEAELDKGDLVSTPSAVADALEAMAKRLREELLFAPQAIIDVPRGKLVYMIEGAAALRAATQEPDDGN